MADRDVYRALKHTSSQISQTQIALYIVAEYTEKYRKTVCCELHQLY